MAVVYNPGKKQDKNIAPQFGQQVGAIDAGQQVQQKGPQGSGSFTNLQKILGANVGAGTQMAQRVGQTAQQQAGQVSKLQEQAKTPVQQTLQQEKTKQSEAEKIGQAVQAAKSTEDINKVIGTYGANISGLTGGTQNLEQAGQTLINLGAKAGTGLAGLQTTGRQLGSEAGRAGLLQQLYKKPTYTKGMSALDQALMQTEGGQALQQQQQQIQQQVKEAEQRQQQLLGLGKEISGLQTSAGDISQALKKQLTGASERADVELGERAKAATEQAKVATDEAKKRLEEGKGTLEDYRILGLDKYVGGQLLNVNIDPSTLQASSYGKSDVATEKDVQAFNALKEILGVSPEYKAPLTKKATSFVGEESLKNIQDQLANQEQLRKEYTDIMGQETEGAGSVTLKPMANSGPFSYKSGKWNIAEAGRSGFLPYMSMADAYKVRDYIQQKMPKSKDLPAINKYIQDFENKYKKTQIGDNLISSPYDLPTGMKPRTVNKF